MGKCYKSCSNEPGVVVTAHPSKHSLRLLPIGGYVRFNDQKTVKLQDGTALNEFEAVTTSCETLLSEVCAA
eukprot:896603-Amphidinium_carterae.1